MELAFFFSFCQDVQSCHSFGYLQFYNHQGRSFVSVSTIFLASLDDIDSFEVVCEPGVNAVLILLAQERVLKFV